MPAADSPALIVARYLKANNYNETYDAFIQEIGLPYDSGNVSKGDLTLETLLEEKKTFDISVQFEKLGVNDGTADTGWKSPSPTNAVEVNSLPTTSNILSARIEHLVNGDQSAEPVLLTSTADRRLHLLDGAGKLRSSLVGVHDSPVLSCTALGKSHLLTSSMSGQLHVSDLSGEVVERRRDHLKYVVKVAVFREGLDDPIVATAGWDGKILIYRPTEIKLGEPKATITLPTKPESMVFVRHPDNGKPVLLVGRTDSSFIFYYNVEEEPRLLGKQNLAPHSNAWVAFTPSSLEICPTDPSLVAVGTSTVPSMKLLIVKLLFPPWDAELAVPAGLLRTSLLDDGPATETQASQARAALAVADREAAAILIHCTTHAPQTAYSTPAVAWRPDGSGVWINGDDGAVRGIEANTGKVVATLQGHEAGSKVRCLCAGMVKGGDDEREILVSGGFDQKLIIWNV
ncbi:hypothetical protein DOTSEDRAFT_141452 [Dothistroma septosporum NZE10]|uniref:LisH domain-containing protein n=1 Tax=Dothistroma septosporum (strain NZE10 / CBS 128990) TaxID=675120 RepID=N1PXZ8_DOTSN|nr:hypothetical protein DOTSEDRAFT_141452 [Dothistroma septosporum NZE10]